MSRAEQNWTDSMARYAERIRDGRKPFRCELVRNGKQASVYDADGCFVMAIDVRSYKRMVIGG